MNTIRKANAADFSAILLLIKEFSVFQKTPERVTVTIEEMISENLFQCLIAETMTGEIAGFASYFFTWYSWTGRALYLDDLYVPASFRSQGIGKSLLEAIVDLAKKERCKKVRWQVSKWNGAAIDFYKKMGAVTDDVEMNCDLLLNTKDN